MSTDLSNDSYNDRLPSSISGDAQVISFGNVQDIQLQGLLPWIDQIRVLCNVMNQPEPVLDLLAFQFQVLFYSGTFTITDPVARLAAKQQLIAKSFYYNSRLGTAAIMQEILVTIYQNAYVQEWFEYGGTAHHFRVLTDNVINDPNVVASIGGVISAVKRASSYFDGFYTTTRAPDAQIMAWTGAYAQVFLKAPRALYHPGSSLPAYTPDINDSIGWGSITFPVGVPGDIPIISTLFADVTQAPYNVDSTGATDAVGGINAALAACPSGKYVYLPTGVYLLASGPIVWPSTLTGTRDHIVLRGDGVGTVLLDTQAAGAVQIGTDTTTFTPTTTPIVSVLSIGQTTVTVSDSSKFVVGQLVVIDQDNDNTGIGTPNDHGMPDGKATRLMRQTVQITGKSGNAITFSPGSYWNWSLSLNPAMSDMGYTGASGNFKITYCGLENVLIDRTRATGIAPSVAVVEAFGCWVMGVTARMSPSDHIYCRDSLECTITGCRIDNSQTHTGSGGVVLYRRCCGFLVYDNIFHQLSPAVSVSSGSCGNVISYNYSRDNMTDSGLQGPAFNANHGGHTAMNLFEGNVGGQFQADGYFGSSSKTTLYRNNFTGIDEDTGLIANSKCIDLCRWNTDYAITANVLGTQAITTSYEQSQGTNFNYSTAVVYRLGYPNPSDNTTDGTKIPPANPLTSGQSLDTRVSLNLSRIANFDVINGLTPLTFSFPPSLYLTAKPAWFGSIPWPAIGPDVSGLLIPIPAQQRWNGAVLPYS